MLLLRISSEDAMRLLGIGLILMVGVGQLIERVVEVALKVSKPIVFGVIGIVLLGRGISDTKVACFRRLATLFLLGRSVKCRGMRY